MCLICMKYGIIIFIITITLSAWVKYYCRIFQTHHARTRIHPHPHHRIRSGSMRRWRPSVIKSTPPFACSTGIRSWVIQMNTRAGDPISPRVWMFFAYKKLLGRTEKRTRDRMYCQTIQTVSDIPREDIARIATWSLLTPTDRQTYRLKENYSIDAQESTR